VRKHEFHDELWYLAPIIQILMDKRGLYWMHSFDFWL